MDKPWLQIKGDPSVRCFVFQQERCDSLFDTRCTDLMNIVEELVCLRGVFHIKIHFSSNQLTCWSYDDPFRYQVYVGQEVFDPSFVDCFRFAVSIERPIIPAEEIRDILSVVQRLRFQDKSLYLRNASINRINGLIGLSFSCDGSHYIEYAEFYRTVKLLWADAGRSLRAE